MTAESRRFELTTSISFPLVGPDALREIAARLDLAISESAGDVPTVKAYFVAVNEEAGEIEVGLRFEGMPPRYINETASDILDAAIEILTNGEQPRLAPVREESTLIPA